MKKFLTIVMALIVALALLSSPFQATAQDPDPLETNKDIARRYIEELFSQGNLDVADELISEEFVNHSPFGADDTRDREGLKQAVTGFLASFSDGEFVIDDMIAEGDLVAIRGTGRGTHDGQAFAGAPATGAKVEFTWTIFLRIKDGKITDRWANVDDLALLTPLGFELVSPVEVAAPPPVTRALARVNDITMYYEIHGEGEPLLFLHGGTVAGAESHPDQIPVFAKEYRVIVPDLRGHGRTTDSDQPLSYALIASDLVQLLDHLNIDQAYVVGFSDGGIIGLDLAIHYPERVRKLVAAGANFTVDGLTDEWLEEIEVFTAVETYPQELAEPFYLNIAPDPDHFPVLLEKVREMWLTQPNYTLEELGNITAPTLIIDGGLGEVVRPEHVQEMAEAIPGAKLQLIPDTGHLAPIEKPEEWNEAVIAFLREPEEVELDSAIVAKIESIVQAKMAESQAPGMTLCIVKDGQLIYSQGFGVAELGTDRPVTPQTVFKAASVTKTFTAAAIMQLVEQGKIDLDAPITTYLPWFSMADEDYQDITVRQVMAHRAGIPPLEDPVEPFYLSWGFDNPQTDDQAMERRVQALSEEELIFAPDESWSYSDWGFTILGTIVAEVSGQSYEDYVKEHLMQPLGMDGSGLMTSDIDPNLLASPHVNSETGEVMVSPVYPYSRHDAPADALHVSCEDLAKWALTALNRGELNGARILQPASYETMWQQYSETGIPEPSLLGYGLGWFVGSIEEHWLVGHPGVDPGFNIKMQLAPDDGLAVVALANWMTRFGEPFPADEAALEVFYGLLGVTVGD
jgi:CubicO group peptidase (beta-lactamase class C family)/predicted ester cyclase